MAEAKKLNHIAIVVKDIDASLSFWHDALGLKLDHIEDVPSQQSKVAFIPIGDSEIELVQPTTSESGVAKYLEKRGEGMHHLCIEVDQIESVLDMLRDKGIQLINQTAVELPGRKMAFIHPKSANGVLVELDELTK